MTRQEPSLNRFANVGCRSQPRLLLGPANYAGQAKAWAEACSRSGLEAESWALKVPGRTVSFPADRQLPVLHWALDPLWKKRLRAHIGRHFSHVLIDGGLPLTKGAARLDRNWRVRAERSGLASELEGLGRLVNVGLLFHGTELRDPDTHAQIEPESPYRVMAQDALRDRRATAEAMRGIVRGFTGPVFVSTPDLLEELEGASWLPVVVGSEFFEIPDASLRRGRLRFLHAPSSAEMSGSAKIDSVLTELDSVGVIDYIRLSRASPHEVWSAMSDADVIVDKCSIGSYGVFACEGMAAGRVVLGHVRPDVRERVKSATGSVLPIVEYNSDTLAEVVNQVIASHSDRVAISSAGRAFAREIHGGARAAEAIRLWIH